MSSNNKYAIGVDLGGTKVRLGLVDENYQVIGETPRLNTFDCLTGDEVVDRIRQGVDLLLKINNLEKNHIKGIGVGSPGPLDPYTGYIKETLNLKSIRNYPLGKSLAEVTNMKVCVDNDANCFGLGEQKAGKAKGMHHVIVGTLGTGFGFAYILNGNVLHGATGTAAEIGMLPFRDGIYEDYVTGRGLRAMHLQLAGEELDPKIISEKAFQGDEKALKTFEKYGEAVAYTLLPFIAALDPEIIVLGGSVSVNWPFFQQSLDTTIRNHIFANQKESLKIVKSEMGEIAAVIGAAGLLDMDYSI
jgi:glucokinase